MLYQAARAGGPLRDARDRVAAFLHARFDADAGGFAGPSGTADLYYTVFALQGLSALHEPLPVEPVAARLA